MASCSHPSPPFFPPVVQHECEILGRGPEATESTIRWESCQKNKGHKNFIPVQEFLEKHLSRSVSSEVRDAFRAFLDLTVRIRTHWTSRDRPDSDKLAGLRGTDDTRLGTGFIQYVCDVDPSTPCPCDQCDGRAGRKSWKFRVLTALHVVYNTEEAKETRCDLFFDDERSDLDGLMKSVWGVELHRAFHGRDASEFWCVTHDRSLGEGLMSTVQRWHDLVDSYEKSTSQCQFSLNLKGYWDPLRNEWRDEYPLSRDYENRSRRAVIVSHPHGKPKKITVGKVKREERLGGLDQLEYYTPTCPGSSGAAVVLVDKDPSTSSVILNFSNFSRQFGWTYLHNGTVNNNSSSIWAQVNYGNDTLAITW